MFEKHLIQYCSPTLASLKTANLFRYIYACEIKLQEQLNFWNLQLKASGVQVCILQKSNHTALIYVYREAYLHRDLLKKGVAQFLLSYGYEQIKTEYVIEMLKRRLNEKTFPHEIGVFLGYPLVDVIAFIQNKGKHSKYTGCWKVYSNEEEALRVFQTYQQCKEIYMRLWKQGRSIQKLTVVSVMR